jgi:hypothetical protein
MKLPLLSSTPFHIPRPISLEKTKKAKNKKQWNCPMSTTR